MSETNKEEFWSKFLTESDSVQSHYKGTHSFEYRKTLTTYFDWTKLSCELWLLDEAEYDPDYNLVLTHDGGFTVANYDCLTSLELDLAKLDLKLFQSYFIVQTKKES